MYRKYGMPRAQGGGETGKPVEKLVWAMRRSGVCQFRTAYAREGERR